MLVSRWRWTDPRDRTTWTISGLAISADCCVGPLVFESDSTTWRAEPSGAVRLTDAELQRVLDRTRRADGRSTGARDVVEAT